MKVCHVASVWETTTRLRARTAQAKLLYCCICPRHRMHITLPRGTAPYKQHPSSIAPPLLPSSPVNVPSHRHPSHQPWRLPHAAQPPSSPPCSLLCAPPRSPHRPALHATCTPRARVSPETLPTPPPLRPRRRPSFASPQSALPEFSPRAPVTTSRTFSTMARIRTSSRRPKSQHLSTQAPILPSHSSRPSRNG